MDTSQPAAMNSLRDVANTLLELQSPPVEEDIGEPEEEQEEELAEDVEEEIEAEADDEAEEVDDQEELEEARDLHTVRVDGEEIQVPYDELLSGYSRFADYQRKTTALAEERRAFQSERDEVLQQKAQYVEVLPKLIEQAQNALGPEPDYDAMPADQAATVFRQRQQAKEAIAAAEAERAREQAELNAALQQRAQEWYASQRQLVEKSIPGYDDKLHREVIDYVISQGADPEAANAIGDATALTIAWKAMQYERAKAKPKPKKRGKKSAAPGARDTVPKPKREFEQAREIARKTGKIDDIARVIQLDRANG